MQNSLKEKAELLILIGFPERIAELNELLESSDFQNRNLSDFHQDLNIPVPAPAAGKDEPQAKRRRTSLEVSSNASLEGSSTGVYACPYRTVPCNQPICDLIDLVKPYIRELVNDCNLLKMWLSSMIPKTEDDNIFGSSIQEETLSEMGMVELFSAAFKVKISHYFISRAEIIAEVGKYPHIEDYRKAVQELDEEEYQSLWKVMCDIHNSYCSLRNTLVKQLAKINY